MKNYKLQTFGTCCGNCEHASMDNDRKGYCLFEAGKRSKRIKKLIIDSSLPFQPGEVAVYEHIINNKKVNLIQGICDNYKAKEK